MVSEQLQIANSLSLYRIMAPTKKFEFNFKSEKLSTNILPTKKHVICAINFEREINRQKTANAISFVVKHLISIWQQIPLPIVDTKTITDEAKKLYNEYSSISYNLNTPSHQQILEKFKV